MTTQPDELLNNDKPGDNNECSSLEIVSKLQLTHNSIRYTYLTNNCSADTP